jgi:hypothetical protein
LNNWLLSAKQNLPRRTAKYVFIYTVLSQPLFCLLFPLMSFEKNNFTSKFSDEEHTAQLLVFSSTYDKVAATTIDAEFRICCGRSRQSTHIMTSMMNCKLICITFKWRLCSSPIDSCSLYWYTKNLIRDTRQQLLTVFELRDINNN